MKSALTQQRKAYIVIGLNSVTVLQCYVACIYSTAGRNPPTVAEPLGLVKLN